jgi:hypothetical protein
MTNEIEDQDLWPTERLDRAEVEIAEEKKRRAAAAAAQQQATLTAEQREVASMKEFGKADADETLKTRRKLLAEFGFDVGWR